MQCLVRTMDAATVWWSSITTIFVAVSWLVHYLWSNQGGGKNRRLPPGSMGIPFLGETIAYYFHFSISCPDEVVAKRRALYGNIFKTHILGYPIIACMDPEVNRYIFLNEGKLFQASFPKTTVDMLGKWSIHNIHGEIHKKVYGLAANFFNPERLCTHFLSDIDEYARMVLTGWSNREVLVNVEAKRYTMFVACKHLLGFSPGENVDAVAKNYSQIFHGMATVPIRIPGTSYSKGLKAREKMAALVAKEIERRNLHPEREHNDFLAWLLRQSDYHFSTEQIRDFLLHLLFAGHDTSGSNLALAIKYLTDTPKALEELRAEHEAIRKKKGSEPLTWEDYKSMNFSQHVVTEALRLTSSGAALFRKVLEDVEVKGYTFPKGWRIVPYTRPTNLSEALYPDPLAFSPWRWQGKNYKSEAHFLPFGAGSRYCPGAELTRLEIIVFLHYLVTCYRWTPTKSDTVSYHPLPHMRHGFPVFVEAFHQNPSYDPSVNCCSTRDKETL